MKLHISVARYHPDSPLWEVFVFWTGADGGDLEQYDLARTFGGEKAARAFADKLRIVLYNRAKRALKGA